MSRRLSLVLLVTMLLCCVSVLPVHENAAAASAGSVYVIYDAYVDEVTPAGPDREAESASEQVTAAQSVTVDPNGGSYQGSSQLKVYSGLGADIEISKPLPPDGKAFVGFVCKKETGTGNLTLTAQYAADVVGASDNPDQEGDGIPDTFQKRISFIVKNGTWQDDTTDSKVLYLTLEDAQGRMSHTGSASLTLPTGMKASKTYTAHGASWDTDTTTDLTVSGTDSKSFTYTFASAQRKLRFHKNDGDDYVLVDTIVEYGQTITILPAGGTYNESSGTTVLKVEDEALIKISKPAAPDGKSFIGWVKTADKKGNLILTATYKQITIPKTGDNSTPLLWVGMLLLAFGSLSVVVFLSKKKK